MNVIELITALTTKANNVEEGARITVESGIAGAKDIYMGWGKERGYSAKDLEAAWKAAQPEKAKGGPRGFADTYYDWLAEASRTEQDAHDYIMSNESANVRNHLTHYLNIWALAETVRSGHKVSRTIASSGKAVKKEKKAEPKDTWEYNSADPYADVRSAKKTLKDVMGGARPAKTKVHPDKVAHLNDEELTKMYTDAFQALNKGRR